MRESVVYSPLPAGTKLPVVRKLIWIKTPRFQGSACSECAWMFKPSGPPAGNSLDEMKEIYERLRDKEFAIHDCGDHPRARRTKG